MQTSAHEQQYSQHQNHGRYQQFVRLEKEPAENGCRQPGQRGNAVAFFPALIGQNHQKQRGHGKINAPVVELQTGTGQRARRHSDEPVAVVHRRHGETI